eukprot:9447243-Karenia_brevis.AAC.1
MHAKDISDHSVVRATLSNRSVVPKSQQPMALWVCKSKEYAQLIQKSVALVDWNAMPIFQQLSLLKELMREACNDARDILLDNDGDSFARDQLFTTMGRMVILNDTAL